MRIHTYMQTHIYKDTHTYTYIFVNTQIYKTYMHRYISHTCIYTTICKHTDIQDTHADTLIYGNTQIYKSHMHIHTYIYTDGGLLKKRFAITARIIGQEHT